MPRFDAPSISKTSIALPAVISRHASHSSQGVGVGPWAQLSALANTRAAVVLPTPRAPLNRNA